MTEDRRERKVVTVLFVDLVGFTSRAEQMDPEDVEAELSRYHRQVRGELERFGGTVEKFIGDAVMAVFGAPVAHEDDAERAVRSALAVRDWAREQDELEVRIGVNTGEALVKLGVRPEAGEAMAAGDVVNTAARLQAAAPEGGILVGETTHRATAQAIDYREAAPVEAKGKAEPVAAWEAAQARARVGEEQRPSTSLVGRRREIELLVSTLARVGEEQSPQLVTLVGVPGIGKSRLVYELSRVVEEDAALVGWRQGRSPPYGEGVTFWALAEIVKAQASILESDRPEQIEQKLSATVAHVVPDESEAQWLVRHLRSLAGLADEAPAGPDEAFAAWRRFLEALSEDRPLVLVFDDLHWADDALLEFVDQLVDRAAGVPLLVLATARPELLQRRPGWGGGKPNALTISLSPLSDEETAQLIYGLLEQPLVTEETQAALLSRAGGNPLYAEQFARGLLEGGGVQELPDTVQGIIAGRLDGLADEEKHLIQNAAVIGKVFWLGAVEAINGVSRPQAEDLLRALERKEFVQRSRRSSVANEDEYAFRHVLIRDVAYAQIPRGPRSQKHRRTASWIESIGRPEDHSELLAHHYLQALELAEAAGLDTAGLGESARAALRDAGDRAAALYAVDGAERFYDAALRLWPADDPGRAQLLFRRAAPAHYMGSGDPERLAEARDALIAAGDKGLAAEAEMLLSTSFRTLGMVDRANEHAEHATSLLADAPASRAAAWALARLATRAALTDEYERAIELASESRAMAEGLDWAEGVSESLCALGVIRAEAGDPGGVQDLERAVEIATEAGALGLLSRAYNNLAVAHQIVGDLDSGYDARLEGARVGERIGSAEEIRWFQGTLADHHYRRGNWDESLRNVEAFLATVDAGSPHILEWQVCAIRAEIALARGDVASAIRDAERALAAGRASEERQGVCFVLTACAHIFCIAGEPERAAPLARELLDMLSRGVGMGFATINLTLFVAAADRLGLAHELLDALADRPPTRWSRAVEAYADHDFTGAAEILRQTGSLPDEAEARRRVAEQLFADGRQAEGEEQLQRALEFYRGVEATAYIRECEALLETSIGEGTST